MYNYGYGYHSMMGGWGAFDVIGHILWFIIVISLIVFVLRMVFGRRHGRMRRHFMDGSFGSFGHQSAIEVLRERYAKGEIDKAEFEERKKVLME